MKITKILALTIAAVMIAALFTACENKPATTKAPETSAPASDTEPAGTEEVTEPAKTEEVTEPAPTEEVTEEPGPVERYDVFRWDFDDATNLGWGSSNMTDVLAEEDGSMHLVVKGGDPNITTKKLKAKIDCDDVDFIEMRIKNATDSYSGQIFISTSDSPGPNESYSYKYDYDYADEDNEWEVIVIETIDINGWTGMLKALRLDYSDGSEGDCYIDYIALQTADKDKAQVTESTETEADPRAGKQVLYKWDFTILTAADMNITSQKSNETEETSEEGEETVDMRWRFSNGVEDAYVENGHLVMKIGSIDPYMVSPEITEDFDCSAVSAVVIRACNKTDMDLAQFFFVTDEADTYSEAGSVRFNFEHKGADNEEWEEIVIDPKESQLWSGQLEQIRIDPSEAHEGIVLLDYCELYG